MRERRGQQFEREISILFKRERLNWFSEMKVTESVLKVTEVFLLD